MSDRKDWYFRQKVTESELDSGFDDLEQGDRALNIDMNLVGIAMGLAVTAQGAPNLTVAVSGPGAAYDQFGERMAITGSQNVDVSLDENSVSTAVATPATFRYISVFLKFKRLLSDLRTDGNSNPVYFDRAESFEFKVAMSAESASPTPPALRSDSILLADITRSFGQTTITSGQISISRRQNMFKTTASPLGFQINKPTILEVFQQIVDTLAAQTTGVGAEIVGVKARTSWLGGRTNPVGNVHSAIDKIITDLATTTAADDGAERIGSQANGNLSAGSVRSQLDSLDTAKGGLALVNAWLENNSWAKSLTGLGSALLGTLANTLIARISGAIANTSVGDHTLIMEWTSPNGTMKNRLYMIGSANGVFGVEWTTNARFDGTNWQADLNSQNASKMGIYQASIQMQHKTAASSWSDASWDRTFFWTGATKQLGVRDGYVEFQSATGGGSNSSTPAATNSLSAKNTPKAWLKAFGLTTIDDEYGIASIASDGGTPPAVLVTFDHANDSTIVHQSIVAMGPGASATDAVFLTVDNYAINGCTVYAWGWNGSAIVQKTLAGLDWSLIRFATVA